MYSDIHLVNIVLTWYGGKKLTWVNPYLSRWYISNIRNDEEIIFPVLNPTFSEFIVWQLISILQFRLVDFGLTQLNLLISCPHSHNIHFPLIIAAVYISDGFHCVKCRTKCFFVAKWRLNRFRMRWLIQKAESTSSRTGRCRKVKWTTQYVTHVSIISPFFERSRSAVEIRSTIDLVYVLSSRSFSGSLAYLRFSTEAKHREFSALALQCATYLHVF